MTPFVTRFETIVTSVSAYFLSTYSIPVYYEHGHPRDIVQTLTEKSQHNTLKNQKYPLIALFQDFKEESIDGLSYNIPEVTVILAVQTLPTYDAADRYKASFVPTLYPLMDTLITKMKTSTGIVWNSWEYDKWDRVFWGKQGLYGVEGNIFNDCIDAIEIRFKNIKQIKSC